MPALAAPVTQASHARIVDELGRRITGGALQVGDGMTVARLEEEFAASRTVVREAIRVLEAHGLVASRRRVGVIVQPRERWRTLDATVIAWTLQGPRRQELLVELTALRVAVEPVAAAQAARTAHPADRDELLRLATQIGRAHV